MAQLPNFSSFVTPYGRNTQTQYASTAARAYGDMANAAQQASAAKYAASAAAGATSRQADASGFSGYAGGLGQLGGAQSDMYGAYSTNLQNLLSNEMGAYGQAETARQVGLANAATAAMSATGQASAGAMGAWGANQAAWAKAMADSHAANQGALSQYGGESQRARAPMLASLANTDLAGYQAGLNYTRDMGKLGLARDLGLGGLATMPGGAAGGVSLTAGGSPLGSAYASGSYGGGSYGGGAGAGALPPYEAWYQDRQTAPAYQSQTEAATRAMGRTDRSVLGRLSDNTAANRADLNAAYYSSQGMPSQMLGQTLSGLTGMLGSNTQSMDRGMNQFYAAMQSPATRGESLLGSELQASRGTLAGLAGQMEAGYGRFGTVRPTTAPPTTERLFMTPVEEEQQRQAVSRMQQNAKVQQRIDYLQTLYDRERRMGNMANAQFYERDMDLLRAQIK